MASPKVKIFWGSMPQAERACALALACRQHLRCCWVLFRAPPSYGFLPMPLWRLCIIPGNFSDCSLYPGIKATWSDHTRRDAMTLANLTRNWMLEKRNLCFLWLVLPNMMGLSLTLESPKKLVHFHRTKIDSLDTIEVNCGISVHPAFGQICPST